MIDITPIVVSLFGLIGTVLTVIVWPLVKAKTTSQQQAVIQSLVNIAVAAAEQSFAGSGKGQEKKAYVLEWLAARGITVDEDMLDAMIEAAVYSLKNGTTA